MRINFKSFVVLAPAVLAVAALATQTAVAESHVINVPFNFVAAGKTCPAGDYAVSQDKYRQHGSPGQPGKTASSGCWCPATAPFAITTWFSPSTWPDRSHLLRTVQFGTMITPRIDKKYKESIPAA